MMASTVAILNLTSKSRPVGTIVTISGIGFSATANQNTVTFNSAPTTVSSAMATQLVVMVPSGATTGPIAVTTPSGSATNSILPGTRLALRLGPEEPIPREVTAWYHKSETIFTGCLSVVPQQVCRARSLANSAPKPTSCNCRGRSLHFCSMPSS
jgi:hypothetical protein